MGRKSSLKLTQTEDDVLGGVASFETWFRSVSGSECNDLISHDDFGNLRGLAYRTTTCLLYTSPSPRDKRQSRMPSSA